MPYSLTQRALQHSLSQLQRLGVVPAAAAALNKDTHQTAAAMKQRLLEDIPAFSASGNPDLLPELDTHILAHIAEIGRLFAGGAAGEFAFVRKHGARRAAQRFPLEATLHAYRCGHKILMHWMRDAALASQNGNTQQIVAAIADFSLDYTDTISTILASEYVARTRAIAAAEVDQRSELLKVLLDGHDESDGRVYQLLKRTAYLEQRQSYCVALVQAVDPVEMENPARVQRIIESTNAAFSEVTIRALIGTRDNLVVAILSDTRRLSGWTRPQTALAERVLPRLQTLGPAVLVGMSSDHPSTAHIPQALREAGTALEFASVAHRVSQYADIPLRQLLVQGREESFAAALPAWCHALLAADDKSRGRLVATMRAYADANLNVLQAARHLDVHPNTIYTRLRRIEALTGLDARQFHALGELLLAVDCARARGRP